MATRQYIGARYVPKFYSNSVDGSTLWESNVVYDPLTYVTLTNGHMYISKKQVPATVGTPASNAEYWLDVGSYNGFIDQLQTEVNALQSSVNDLESDLSATNRRTLTNASDIDNEISARINGDNNLSNAIANEASARQTTDASLQTQINNIIAPSGEAPSAAEVQNARIANNGTVFGTLGNAIRGQINEREQATKEFAISNFDDLINPNTGAITLTSGMLGWTQGSINVGSGAIDSIETTRIKTESMIDMWEFEQVSINPDSGYAYNYYYYDSEREFVGGQPNVTTAMTWKHDTVKQLGRRYLRFVGRTTGGSDAVTPSDGSHYSVVAIKNPEPQKVRIMSYNVGMFNHGVSPYGFDPSTAAEGIEKFKEFLAKYQPDILAMNEFTQTLIQGTTENSNTVIFNPFFKDGYGLGISYGNSLRSQFLLHNADSYNLIDLPSPYTEAQCRQAETVINHRIFTLLCIHFVVSVPSGGTYTTVEDAREAEMTAALAKLADKDNAILFGDFNSSSTGEKEKFNNMAIAAGFVPVNGEYFSFKPTWPYNNPYNYDDNIYVKGNVKVLSREVLASEVDNLPSDHIPIMTDILVY